MPVGVDLDEKAGVFPALSSRMWRSIVHLRSRFANWPKVLNQRTYLWSPRRILSSCSSKLSCKSIAQWGRPAAGLLGGDVVEDGGILAAVADVLSHVGKGKRVEWRNEWLARTGFAMKRWSGRTDRLLPVGGSGISPPSPWCFSGVEVLRPEVA